MKKQKYSDEKILTKEIEKITDRVEKSNSFSRTIMKGLIYGAATAIGATIIAAIVITILSKTINTVTDIPVVGDSIGNLLEQTKINSILEK